MSNITPIIPKMKVGLVVVTPATVSNITRNKKYVIHKVRGKQIYITNDLGDMKPYDAFQFMEADLYFTMCLFSTMISLYSLYKK